MEKVQIYKSYFSELPIVDVENRTFRASITTSSPDRINDIILPESIRLKNYFNNPTVLWNHNQSIPAIATCINLIKNSISLDGEANFVKNVQLSEDLYQCVNQGAIRSVSIGFIPISDKINKSGQRVFTDIEMFEWSLCNIGMNAEALVKALDIVKTPYLVEQFDFQKKSLDLEDRVNELYESKQSFEDLAKSYSELKDIQKELETRDDRINQLQETLRQQDEIIKKINLDMKKMVQKDTMKLNNEKFETALITAISKKLGI
jgi:HK97 family phage prohead protease